MMLSQVIVSAEVGSPGRFSVQLKDTFPLLESLMDDIAIFINNTEVTEVTTVTKVTKVTEKLAGEQLGPGIIINNTEVTKVNGEELGPGMVCLVQRSYDDVWYRGRVEEAEEGDVRVREHLNCIPGIVFTACHIEIQRRIHVKAEFKLTCNPGIVNITKSSIYTNEVCF
jgi:hypothetical protein